MYAFVFERGRGEGVLCVRHDVDLVFFVWHVVNKITYNRKAIAGTRASKLKVSSLAFKC